MTLRRSLRPRTLVLACSLLAPLAGIAPAALGAVAITIDGTSDGRTFDGVGGLSAGASSRLLFDYPEPERSQILDYLFKPNYGAACHILKVEIGGDTNSTSGSEPSHMHSRDDLSGSRGYEWWLMKEAKKRNPDIRISALAWGAPGWVEGGFWSRDNIDYLIKWLDLAKEQGLTVDYIGGWNESGYDAAWYVRFKKVLQAKYPHIKLVAADDIPQNWRVADTVLKDPDFANAVDILGEHSPAGWRSEYLHAHVTTAARKTGKPLWASEQSALGRNCAVPHARALNRHYIDGRITSTIDWSLVTAWYPSLPLPDTGWILADRPWSGYYELGPTVWVKAHTTQFTRPGWKYLDTACGYLPRGASYVTLRSPDSKDFTVVLETVDQKSPQDITLTVTGGLPDSSKLHLWSTDLTSADPARHFVRGRDLAPSPEGVYALTLQPGRVYTLSTTTGQAKGDAGPRAARVEGMPLTFAEDFDKVPDASLARYFSDVSGAFDAAPAGGGRPGKAYRQSATTRPVTWGDRKPLPPTTIVGDPRWWGDYEASADVLLEQPGGSAELIGRVSCQRGLAVPGYHLHVTDAGNWRLYSQEFEQPDVELASGQAEPFAPRTWHRMALRFKGRQVTAILDGKTVADLRDDRHLAGQVALRVGEWQAAQFDNVRVERTADWPRWAPHAEMTTAATSEVPEFVFGTGPGGQRGYTYAAANAIDDHPGSSWSVPWAPRPALPQAITLDLGREREIHGLTCQPPYNGPRRSYIAGYAVYASTDGKSFEKLASGTWPQTISTQIATWPARTARFVRLEATGQPTPSSPSAAEVNVALTPLTNTRE